MDNLIADLKLIIEHIKVKYQTDRVILIGHSWGSVLGTQYIQKFPNDVICYIGYGQVIDFRRGEKIGYEKLTQLIKIAGKQGDIKKLGKLNNYPYDIKTDNILKSSIRVRRLQGKYGLIGNTAKVVKIALKSPVFELSDILRSFTGLKVNRNLFSTMLTYSIWDFLEYKIPIYYVLGRDDWQVPSTLAAEYFNRIQAPQKELFWIENAGHLTDIDNPTMFTEAIRKIIKGLRAGTS